MNTVRFIFAQQLSLIFNFWTHHFFVCASGTNLFAICISKNRSSTGPPDWCIIGFGIFGAGKEQYIVNQDLVPGAKGFWNLATLLLINLSQLAVLTVVLAIIGFLGWAWTARKERALNFISVLLFVALILISLFQTFNPEFSNG